MQWQKCGPLFWFSLSLFPLPVLAGKATPLTPALPLDCNTLVASLHPTEKWLVLRDFLIRLNEFTILPDKTVESLFSDFAWMVKEGQGLPANRVMELVRIRLESQKVSDHAIALAYEIAEILLENAKQHKGPSLPELLHFNQRIADAVAFHAKDGENAQNKALEFLGLALDKTSDAAMQALIFSEMEMLALRPDARPMDISAVLDYLRGEKLPGKASSKPIPAGILRNLSSK